MRRRLSLATQILLLQLVIVGLTATVGAVVTARLSAEHVEQRYGRRVLAIAQSVAAIPAVREAFDDPDPSQTIQPIAQAVMKASDTLFVVVANTEQIRYAHPDAWKIGRRLSTDATTTLAGETYVGIQVGTLGPSLRAKTPVRDENGQVIGVVSVGVPVSRIQEESREALPAVLGWSALALLLGVAGSWLLARRVKRQTFGLEPREIAALLEQREATLHGIREGMVALGPDQRITMVNDEARRLLDLPEDATGRRLGALRLPSRLQDVLSGADGDEPDQLVLRRGRVLTLNRMTVRVRGRLVGSVITLRDRTEMDALNRELRGARTTTDALRAQAHEFANRMHTVAGLIELGEYEEARRFIVGETRAHEELALGLGDRVREPALAALLLAKSAAAAERGVALRLTADSNVAADVDEPQDLVTVVGNLVDNAIEALGSGGGEVEVAVSSGPDGVHVAVRDSGDGVAPDLVEEVFQHGFTTKVARSGGQRGLGLALTRQTCVRRGGWIRVANEPTRGAVFTAFLPAATVGSRR